MAVDRLERQAEYPARYNHADWQLRRRICRTLLKTIGFTLLAKVSQVDGLENFPDSGPAIFMINHIAFIDPIVVLYLRRGISFLCKDRGI
jgi:1-acyl-sn-glycerol-3-phosphate acyltransferase